MNGDWNLHVDASYKMLKIGNFNNFFSSKKSCFWSK